EAIHEASSHRVAERDHDDRNRASYFLRCLSGRRGAYDDDVRVEVQAFGGEGGKPFATPVSGKVVDVDGLSVDIAQIAQGREERFKSRRPQCPGIKREEAEPRYSWLCPRGERPRRRRRGAKQRDELAAHHSISSSARARSDGGRMTPRVLAVLRLITR